MRFNFITVYSDVAVPVFTSSPTSSRSLICLRGIQDSIVTSGSFSAFGPVASSFNSDDFFSFSKLFKMRNAYLSSYSTKKMTQFGNYSNLSMYNAYSGFTFEKNVVLFQIVRNSRYNSLIFRANGFRFGSLPFSAVMGRRNKLFYFFRGLNFYNLFVGRSSLIFMDRSSFWSVLFDFIIFLKKSFFKYFVGLGHSRGRAKRPFYRSQRQKVSFLKQAFLHFFFFQKNLMRTSAFFKRGCISLVNFSTFYLSESIFFNSKLGFSRRGAHRYLPLRLC